MGEIQYHHLVEETKFATSTVLGKYNLDVRLDMEANRRQMAIKGKPYILNKFMIVHVTATGGFVVYNPIPLASPWEEDPSK